MIFFAIVGGDFFQFDPYIQNAISDGNECVRRRDLMRCGISGITLKANMEKAGWCYKFRFYQRCHRCRVRSASWIFVKTKPKFNFFVRQKYQSIKKKVMSTHATLPTQKKAQFGWILQCIRLVRRFSPPVFHEDERRGTPSSFAWLLLLETSREKWWWLRDGRLFEASTGIFGTWLPFTCSTTNIQVGSKHTLAACKLCFCPGVFVCCV